MQSIPSPDNQVHETLKRIVSQAHQGSECWSNKVNQLEAELIDARQEALQKDKVINTALRHVLDIRAKARLCSNVWESLEEESHGDTKKFKKVLVALESSMTSHITLRLHANL